MTFVSLKTRFYHNKAFLLWDWKQNLCSRNRCLVSSCLIGHLIFSFDSFQGNGYASNKTYFCDFFIFVFLTLGNCWGISTVWKVSKNVAFFCPYFPVFGQEETAYLDIFQASACKFTKINTAPWVFFTFFKLYKWYQIAPQIFT